MDDIAMSLHADAVALLHQPPSFQISPDTYHYVYTEIDQTWQGQPVYRCCRGRDNLPGRLYLMHHAGRWQAFQVAGDDPNDAAEIIARMTPAFRAGVGDDVRLEGNHLWECWDVRGNRWWPPSAFSTRLLH